MSDKRVEYPLKWCNHCDRSTQCRDNNPVCFWCNQPWGSGTKKEHDDFQGTELEKDVIQAATAWFEDISERDPQMTPAEAALHNAVYALGSQQGGF